MVDTITPYLFGTCFPAINSPLHPSERAWVERQIERHGTMIGTHDTIFHPLSLKVIRPCLVLLTLSPKSEHVGVRDLMCNNRSERYNSDGNGANLHQKSLAN